MKTRLEGLSFVDGGVHDKLYEDMIDWDCCYFDHETGILYQGVAGEGNNTVKNDAQDLLES